MTQDNIKQRQQDISTSQKNSEKYDLNIDKRSLKGTIALFTCLSLIHGSFIPFLYLSYYAYTNQIYWILVIQILLYIYQLSPYCQYSDAFTKFVNVQLQYKHFKDWTCTFEEPLKKEKCMIAAHPHGVLDFTFIMNSYVYYRGTKLLGSRMILSIPLNGIFLRYLGCSPVDPSSMSQMMKKGQNIALIPGGFEEATLTSTSKCRIFLKNRKGFIKYAVKYGYEIYPMYGFGENKIFNVFEPLLNFRLMLNKFKLPAVLFWTKYGLFPNDNIRLNTVLGKPLKFPQCENPTRDQINEYHAIYLKAVVDLYNNNKDKYGETSELEIY